MDVFQLRNRVIGAYRHYIESFLSIRDPRARDLVASGLDSGHLWPEPLIQLNPAFEPGPDLAELVDEGLLHSGCMDLFRRRGDDGRDLGPLRSYRHQAEAVRAARGGRPYVLTTGTGSGKSLAYILPIVDDVLRRPDLDGLRAIIVYPMNALANSQEEELRKFLDGSPVRFAGYTGQTRQEVREDLRARPPHILLTNYVMLELILTRLEDQKLLSATEHLRFLVFDELHTYRGRQGADVAMLIRRAREASRADDIIHVGTSATLAQAESWPDQQAEIALFASQVFGVEVSPDDVIGETLRRRTSPIDFSEPSHRDSLRQRIQGSPPQTIESDDPLASWVETTLGLTRDPSGRWTRAEPLPLAGADGAVSRLARLTELDEDRCRSALELTLMQGALQQSADAPSFFAFRLHQFLSRGGAVYSTLEPAADRELTLDAQRFAPPLHPKGRRRPFLPLAFCRECGQDYFVVRRKTSDDEGVVYLERNLTERVMEDDVEAGFLLVDPEGTWPSDEEAVREKLPASWLEEHRGKLRVIRARRDRVPLEVWVANDGSEDSRGTRALFQRAPFLFCLQCGVSYAPTARSDFGKLANLGSEGRSTATTVLGLAALRELRGNEGLGTARKLLSFTDNRQDASLQAGHFNDFVEIGLLRSGLYRAVAKAGDAGLRHDELMPRLFDALALPREAYCLNPDAGYGRLEEADHAFRDVLGYSIYRDLERGWRVNQPNLEQCGLLEIDYPYLRELCDDESAWAQCPPPLKEASPATRHAITKVLLDTLRRELVIKVDPLRRAYQEGLVQRSRVLTERWQVDDVRALEKSRIALARPARRGRRASRKDFYFLSARSAFGQYLRRTLDSLSGLQATQEALDRLLEVLHEPGGLLEPVLESRRTGEPPGYQLLAQAMVWKAGDGKQAFHDPLLVRDPPAGGLSTNRFFVDFYRGDPKPLLELEAREHTAQVRVDDRQDREERFRRAELPLLFCSSTMELGVDIRDLAVVHLRNVPPTPANYAQRSGRAGRSGQPALVLTYCSTGSPHDQYFFERPTRMVAGAVQRPRLDLSNEDLLRSHVHAIWLALSGLRFGSSMQEVLQVEGIDTESLPLRPEIRSALGNRQLTALVRQRAYQALGHDLEKADLVPSATGWLDRVLSELHHSLDRACERWRHLFFSTQRQRHEQDRIWKDFARSESDRQIAKRLRSEAERKLELILQTHSDARHSDFYPYRYLASEGFLPGYSFPRLPVTAYLPARRTRNRERDDALNRPRFLAISEFGPRSSIYHEGSRYVIDRVNLLAEESGSLVESLAQCKTCGYVIELRGDQAPDVCPSCGERPLQVMNNLFRMRNVDAVRRDRIHCDEEERRRLGYDVATGLRFPIRDGRPSSTLAHVLAPDGSKLASLRFGRAAEIFRFNRGPRHSQNRRGFVLDLERGYWAREDTLEHDEESRETPLTSRAQRVIPYVRDHRNSLVFEPGDELEIGPMASLQAAIGVAIQFEFELEDSELASEPLPGRGDRRSILFFESAEGGAGVLRRLVDESDAIARVARRALRICHFEGPDPKPCEGACYRCLLSYSNQRDHDLLDRHPIEALLRELSRARVVKQAGPLGRHEHMETLRRLTDSVLERRFLDLLDSEELTLPSHAQVLVEDAGTRLDFAYREHGAALFIDGPHHDEPDQQETDRRQREALEDLGWTVLVFHHDADWREIIARYPDLFGKFREGVPGRAPLTSS